MNRAYQTERDEVEIQEHEANSINSSKGSFVNFGLRSEGVCDMVSSHKLVLHEGPVSHIFEGNSV